eukprot:TRINITY_DN24216_c0_g1_i1.p1 TRINITY_DN24216_c0_g1~~TRINITY_DN24216_c0_g1_i1.p1  ORF type:complete len:364 (-),score=43.04 TRINITY_DN24216_c0_g1_i1:197-1288(-)
MQHPLVLPSGCVSFGWLRGSRPMPCDSSAFVGVYGGNGFGATRVVQPCGRRAGSKAAKPKAAALRSVARFHSFGTFIEILAAGSVLLLPRLNVAEAADVVSDKPVLLSPGSDDFAANRNSFMELIPPVFCDALLKQTYGALRGWSPSEIQVHQMCIGLMVGSLRLVRNPSTADEPCRAFAAKVALSRAGGRTVPSLIALKAQVCDIATIRARATKGDDQPLHRDHSIGRGCNFGNCRTQRPRRNVGAKGALLARHAILDVAAPSTKKENSSSVGVEHPEDNAPSWLWFGLARQAILPGVAHSANKANSSLIGVQHNVLSSLWVGLANGASWMGRKAHDTLDFICDGSCYRTDENTPEKLEVVG